ncbi:MAG: protein-disulfide isomerase [Alphaproteobacteria bacterium]|jgi:protein-disulfide isomerase
MEHGMDDADMMAQIGNRKMIALQIERLAKRGRTLLLSGLLSALLLTAGSLVTGGAAAQSFSDGQHGQIESIIKQYILAHPEVIVESMERWQQQENAQRDKRKLDALSALDEQVYSHPMTPTSGAAKNKSDLIVVEFFDYQCSYCKKVIPTVMNILKTDKKIQFAWKEYPILGPASRFAAEAAMAAKKQDKYFEFHIAIMELKGRLSNKRILAAAEKSGLDMARLINDMKDPAIGTYIQETLELGHSLGITGTPAFIIGKTIVPGAISEEQMRDLIKVARAEKQ